MVATSADGQPARRLAPATVNRVLAAVSSFYEYAILAGVWDRANPIEKRPDPALLVVGERHRPFMGRASRQRPVRRAVRVKTPRRVPRSLSDGQVQALLGAMRCVRDRAIVLLMLQGGLRPGEVLGLHLEDVAYEVPVATARDRLLLRRGARNSAVGRYGAFERPAKSAIRSIAGTWPRAA